LLQLGLRAQDDDVELRVDDIERKVKAWEQIGSGCQPGVTP
jgi:hypothetical protein